MIVVYIASPYTLGDSAENVGRQMKVFIELMTLGYCPIAPLFGHFLQIFSPQRYADWMQIDLEYVRRSDCVLRLSGQSPGADSEVQCAQEHGILVIYSVEELRRLKPI